MSAKVNVDNTTGSDALQPSASQPNTNWQAFRGSILHFLDDPSAVAASAHRHLADGVLLLRDGRVHEVGEADDVLTRLPPGTAVVDYSGRLIMPGFVDTHTHFPQVDVIASHGEQLLGWLERYTFPTEASFADNDHAREVAQFFIEELLRNGTTTAMVFGTVHSESVDAIFEAAESRGARMLAGKAMMDRNTPEQLRDSAASSYEVCKCLIEKWHGRGRLRYAVTPRCAPTSSEAQLHLCGRLLDEHTDLHLQSHVAENRDEIAWAAEMFPWSRSYLDVYDHFGLLRARSIYAHGIYLDDIDRGRMAQTGAAIAFCPTSNLFLGSGLFDIEEASTLGIRVGLATDVGAGTSFSMLRTLDEAYKVSMLRGCSLDALRAFYLATLGSARALYLDQHIGNFEPGKEADFVVIDLDATPLLKRRMSQTRELEQRLFLLMVLGDDRCVFATHLMGCCVYTRTAA